MSVSELVSQSGTQYFCDLEGILYDQITITREIDNGRGWSGTNGDDRRWPGEVDEGRRILCRDLKRGALVFRDFLPTL